MRYLQTEQLISNLSLGKPAEQWLGTYVHNDYVEIRWLRICQEKPASYSKPEGMGSRIVFPILLVTVVVAALVLMINIDLFEIAKRVYWRSRVEVKEVLLSDGERHVYLKSYPHGFDHEIKVVSTSKVAVWGPDASTDYILSSISQVFYRTDGDTLILFVNRPFAAPDNLPQGIIITQVVLENPEFMELYEIYRKNPGELDFF